MEEVFGTFKVLAVMMLAVKVVNAPVDDVTPPIGVLLIVPPEIVKASATLVSVIQPVQVMLAPPFRLAEPVN